MPKITKIGAIIRPNGQLKYGPMEKYKSNYGWIESRILGRTLPQTLMTTVTSIQHRTAKPKSTAMQETCLKHK